MWSQCQCTLLDQVETESVSTDIDGASAKTCGPSIELQTNSNKSDRKQQEALEPSDGRIRMFRQATGLSREQGKGHRHIFRVFATFANYPSKLQAATTEMNKSLPSKLVANGTFRQLYRTLCQLRKQYNPKLITTENFNSNPHSSKQQDQAQSHAKVSLASP